MLSSETPMIMLDLLEGPTYRVINDEGINRAMRGKDVRVEKRTLTTEDGLRTITEIEQEFPDDNVQGAYVPMLGLIAYNRNMTYPAYMSPSHRKFNNKVHEHDHFKFKKTLGTNFYDPDGLIGGLGLEPVVEEYANRLLTDEYVSFLLKKPKSSVHTASDYISQVDMSIYSHFMPSAAEYIAKRIRQSASINANRALSLNLDIAKDYKHDLAEMGIAA
jgi:hypothetical protein